MRIWVDADACPVVIKDILFKAAKRTGIKITLVANRQMRIPVSSCIDFIKVSAGFDVADNEIVKRLLPGHSRQAKGVTCCSSETILGATKHQILNSPSPPAS